MRRPVAGALPEIKMSTFERAYQLARTGTFADLRSLKARLEGEGYRSIDTLLASRSVRDHLAAICAATYSAAELENAAQHA
jgi:hypothetical protein